jgi:hypothetical protein
MFIVQNYGLRQSGNNPRDISGICDSTHVYQTSLFKTIKKQAIILVYPGVYPGYIWAKNRPKLWIQAKWKYVIPEVFR